MHSFEDRNKAVKLYEKYGKRVAAIIRELGYENCLFTTTNHCFMDGIFFHNPSSFVEQKRYHTKKPGYS